MHMNAFGDTAQGDINLLIPGGELNQRKAKSSSDLCKTQDEETLPS